MADAVTLKRPPAKVGASGTTSGPISAPDAVTLKRPPPKQVPSG